MYMREEERIRDRGRERGRGEGREREGGRDCSGGPNEGSGGICPLKSNPGSKSCLQTTIPIVYKVMFAN